MLSELAATVVKQSEMPASPDSPTNKTELADHMWKALRHAQRTVYFIGQDDAKLMNFKISEMHGQGDIQDQSYTFRIQIPSQMYQKTVSGVRKTMQNGGLCVVIKDGDSSTMYVHSSIPGDAQQQMLKNMNIDVQVENQAIFFFNCLGLSQSDEESKIQNTFNCQAVGGCLNAAAVCGSTLAVFTDSALMKTPEFSSELFTVALTFDRHHCPWAKILPVSKPYKLGVFGLWCSVQTLFKIKAKLQEKLADVGLISVVSNPMGRSVSVSVQGLENALKARSKIVRAMKELGLRCIPKNNRVVLFDTFGSHPMNMFKEVKVDADCSNAAQFQELLDPQIANPNPDQCVLHSSVMNTVWNLGYPSSIKPNVELVFSLGGVKCVGRAGKIRQAVQQGQSKHLCAYLNLYRNQLTVKTCNNMIEDSISQIVKSLRGVNINAELLHVIQDNGDEPDHVAEEECSMLRKLCGQTLVRCKDLLEENLDVFSDDTDPVHALSGNTATVALHVTGIDCPSCALLLRGTIKTVIHGITSSSVDFAQRTLYVSFNPEAVAVDEIQEKLLWLGHKSSVIREGEDLRLKLTDTLWANENAVAPCEDQKTQAMLDSQLLLYELWPQPLPLEPMLDTKYYAPIEETGVETPLVVTAGGSAPAYTHITTIPVQLLQKEAEKEAVPVYMSIFSQMVQSAGLDESEEGTSPQAAQAPFDGLCEAFYLVMQSPSSFCMTSQVINPPSFMVNDFMEPPVLHFQHQWTFWFDITVDTKDKHAEDSLRKLGEFSTLQGFWKFWTNIAISNLKDGCNLRLFRSDIQPTWEHDANREGGRWSARSLGKTKRFKLWTEVVLSLVGAQLLDNTTHEVCGVCLSSKPGGDRIEIWVDGGYGHRTSGQGKDDEPTPDRANRDPMDEMLRKMLFPEDDKKYFFYQSHADYIEQRKTQRGGRRAKARKQNQLEAGSSFEEGEGSTAARQFFGEYDYPSSPPAAAKFPSGPGNAAGGRGVFGGVEQKHSLASPPGANQHHPSPQQQAFGHHQHHQQPRAPQAHAMPMFQGSRPGFTPGVSRTQPHLAHQQPAHLHDGAPAHLQSLQYQQQAALHLFGRQPNLPQPNLPQPLGSSDQYSMLMGSQKQAQQHAAQQYLQRNLLGNSASLMGAREDPPRPPVTSLQQRQAMESLATWPMSKPTAPLNLLDDDDDDPMKASNMHMRVGQLLEELHLEQYVPVMMKKGYDDWSSMQELSESDLVDMGFKPGHRKRLLASLRSG